MSRSVVGSGWPMSSMLSSIGSRSLDLVNDNAGHLDRRWTVVSDSLSHSLQVGSS